ncbi:MAG: hypothetical protein HY446_00090 [Candidatus Niyogibacteria bacterium]|nr:hypothetical protein [Candidatus Niyogibacteria bacterium]
MNNSAIDWRRVEKALHQEGLKKNLVTADIRRTFSQTRELVGICGDFSWSRKMALNIGRVLLSGGNIVLVPVCLNYADLANFKRTLPVFIREHIVFLKRAREINPKLEPKFLIPDQEAKNEDLLRLCGVSEEELARVLSEAGLIVAAAAKKEGWGSVLMSSVIDNLEARETEAFNLIKDDQELLPKVQSHALLRREMYRKGSGSMSFEDMQLRTAQTAAQYLVLGKFVADSDMFIVNHTTTSLQWYKETSAGVLHNPAPLL